MITLLIVLPLAAALIVWLLPLNQVSAGALALLAALAEIGIWVQLLVRYDFTRGGLQFSERRSWFSDLNVSYHVGVFGFSVWLIGLTEPIITIRNVALSWRDIILIAGGLFLIAKATHEIHAEVEASEQGGESSSPASALFWVILQIIVIDIVFSLDSIITAIGMAQDLEIMVAAVVIACVIMYVSSKPVARFVAEHPTTKMLALAFLVLIGVALVADGFKFHIPRGYIYFAITFSAAVEFFNVLAKRNRKRAAK